MSPRWLRKWSRGRPEYVFSREMSAPLTIRPAGSADLDQIIDVGSAALGWLPGEPNEVLFRWKHLDNPFGESQIWVAESAGRIAGYRAFMRWELLDGAGRTLRCVRAVDTATHPGFQRQGIFSRLTLHGLAEVETESVDIVFNTPNDQSRPGYLKMGWIEVGALPIAFRPTSLRSLRGMLTARTAAAKWSEESATGHAASDAFDDPVLPSLLAGQPARRGLSTPLTPQFMRWRYGLEDLRYRVWMPDGLDAGAVFFRVRKRGAARECTVGHVLSPGGDDQTTRRLLRSLTRAVDADYVLRLGGPDPRTGFLPGFGLGPMLTARRVCSEPPPNTDAWDLELGDIELF